MNVINHGNEELSLSPMNLDWSGILLRVRTQIT